MNASERITRMKNALAAAEAVQAEIERRNEGDTNPFRVEQREPLLQRAIIEVRDTRRRSATSKRRSWTWCSTMPRWPGSISWPRDWTTRYARMRWWIWQWRR